MRLIDQLERKLGRHYIRELMKYLCIGMLGVFILDYLPLQRSAIQLLYFNRSLILNGEIWRVVTFLFVPPTGSILWFFFNLYFYFFLGSSLEHYWGSARFNIYYLLGTLGAVAAGFICGVTTNHYLNLSLLLCYAVLNPEMKFMLFFFIPVKVKWLGMAWGAYMIYEFITLPWSMKPIILLSLLPFFLFFGKQAWVQLRMDIRRLRRWIQLKINR